MQQPVRLSALTLSALVLSGCLCWFVPCDKAVDVHGTVSDHLGHPVAGADVELYGVTHKTDAVGCFGFGGHLAARGFAVSVRHPDFKPYQEAKKFGRYRIEVQLQPLNSRTASTGTWQVVPESEPSSRCASGAHA